MQGHQFIYCLTDKPGTSPNFWQVGANGMVKLAAKSYFLEFSPDGWLDISIQNIRNKIYFGVDRSVTIPFGYVEDGANILKTIFYDFGPETPVYLKVCKLTLDYTPGVEYGYWYKQIYCGQVDLTEWNHAGAKVTVNTLEDGLPKYLKANDRTVFELPMNVPEAIWVKDDGIRLHNKASFKVIDDLVDAGGGVIGFKNCGTIPVVFLKEEGSGYGLAYQSQNQEQINDDPGFATGYVASSNNWCVKNTGLTDITFPLAGTVDLNCIANPAGLLDGNMDIYFKRSDAAEFNVCNAVNVVAGQNYSFPFSLSITLRAGESLFLLRDFNNNAGDPTDPTGVIIRYLTPGLFDASAITRRPTTYIRAFRPQYILQQLIKLVTDNTFTADDGNRLDNYFGDNYHADKVFSCGNAVRGFDEAVMKISLAIFFNHWNSFDAVGLVPIGSKVRMDRKKNLIDFTQSISLGTVSRPVVSFQKENSFNELNIGYPEIKNEAGNMNGNEAFCCGFTFSMGTMLASGKLERISEVIANCYEIENIRNVVADKTTTDFKDDNKLVIFHIEKTLIPADGSIPASYALNRDLNPFITAGLIEPESVYNLELSPKRNLLRMGDELRSRLYKCDTKILKYANADKNNKLITTVGLVTVEEKAPVNLGSLDNAYLHPVVITAEVIVPFNVLDLLDLNPLQLFDFDINGNNFKGLLQEVFQAPGTDKQQTCKFLSVATNNLSLLKDYYG